MVWNTWIEWNKRVFKHQTYFNLKLGSMIMESILVYGRLEWKKLMLGGYSKKLDIKPKYHPGCYFWKPFGYQKNGI